MLLSEKPQITARSIAEEIGITERAVRKIIADLEGNEYIKKSREGRRVRYELNRLLPLRRPNVRDIAVGELLDLFESQKLIQQKKNDGNDE